MVWRLTRQIKEKTKNRCDPAFGDTVIFDYAQKGIRYGVSNYLLKHELSSELILKELEEVKEKLERAGNKKKIYQKYFMNQLIYHRVTAEELDKSILGNRFFLLLLHKRNPVIQGEFAETRWTEEEQEAVRNILEESLENIVFYAADVQITENNWILLYRIENTASKYMVNSLILRKCHQIADQLELCFADAFLTWSTATKSHRRRSVRLSAPYHARSVIPCSGKMRRSVQWKKCRKKKRKQSGANRSAYCGKRSMVQKRSWKSRSR